MEAQFHNPNHMMYFQYSFYNILISTDDLFLIIQANTANVNNIKLLNGFDF